MAVKPIPEGAHTVTPHLSVTFSAQAQISTSLSTSASASASIKIGTDGVNPQSTYDARTARIGAAWSRGWSA